MPPISNERPSDSNIPRGEFDDDVDPGLEGPRRADRPNLVGRIRERIATYRALARPPRDDYDDSLQIVSGRGAPARPVRPATMYSHASRTTAGQPPPDGRRPWTPSSESPGAAAPVDPVAGPSPAASAAFPVSPEFMPASHPQDRVHTGSVQMQREPARDAMPEAGSDSPPFNAFGGSLGPISGYSSSDSPPLHGDVRKPAEPTMPQRFEPSAGPAFDKEFEPDAFHVPPPRTGATARASRATKLPAARAMVERMRAEGGDRRALIAYAGGVALLMVAGFATGRSTVPAPPSMASASFAKPTPQAAGPPAPPVTPAPASPAPLARLSNQKSLGSGGAGYQVKGIRYGAHPGDFRIVFDLVGTRASAGGAPAAVIGWRGPTTLQVRLNDVAAATTAGPPPPGAPITDVRLIQPSPVPGTAYEFTIARPATFTASYLQGPLRLIVDLH